MPLLEEQKRAIVVAMGEDPSKYTTDPEGDRLIPIQLAREQPTLSSTYNAKPDDDLTTTPLISPHRNTATQTFLKSAAQAAPSAVGSGLGMWGGIAAAAALAPESGGLSLLLPIAGAIAGGLATGEAQKAIEPESWKQNVAQAQQEHPWASLGGELTTIPLGGFKPNPKNLARAGGAIAKLAPRLIGGSEAAVISPTANEINALKNVAFGATINPTIQTAESIIRGQGIPSVGDLAQSAAIGALFNDPNFIGKLYGIQPSNIKTEPGREDLSRGRAPVKQQPTAKEPQQLTTTPAQLFNPAGEMGTLSGVRTTPYAPGATEPLTPLQQAYNRAALFNQVSGGPIATPKWGINPKTGEPVIGKERIVPSKSAAESALVMEQLNRPTDEQMFEQAKQDYEAKQQRIWEENKQWELQKQQAEKEAKEQFDARVIAENERLRKNEKYQNKSYDATMAALDKQIAESQLAREKAKQAYQEQLRQAELENIEMQRIAAGRRPTVEKAPPEPAEPTEDLTKKGGVYKPLPVAETGTGEPVYGDYTGNIEQANKEAALETQKDIEQGLDKYSEEGTSIPPIGDEEYRRVWDSWENHAAMIGKALLPDAPFEKQLHGGKNAIEAIAKKDPLGNRIIDILTAKGVIHATQQQRFRDTVSGLASTLRERNLGTRYQEAESPAQTAFQKEIRARIAKERLPTTPGSGWKAIFNRLAGVRHINVTEEKGLNVEGRPIEGQAVLRQGLQKALVKLNPELAGADTPAHEFTHILFNDASARMQRGEYVNPREAKFVKDYYKLIEQSPDYANWVKSRKPGTDTSPEEYAAINQGYEAYRRAIDTTPKLKKWWQDYASFLKVRYGRHATEEDFRRLGTYKLYHDPSFLKMMGATTPVTTGGIRERGAEKETRIAPVTFAHTWPADERVGIPETKYYNLNEDIPGHPKGSTVSEQTLRAAGYTLPTDELRYSAKGTAITNEEKLRELQQEFWSRDRDYDPIREATDAFKYKFAQDNPGTKFDDEKLYNTLAEYVYYPEKHADLRELIGDLDANRLIARVEARLHNVSKAANIRESLRTGEYSDYQRSLNAEKGTSIQDLTKIEAQKDLLNDFDSMVQGLRNGTLDADDGHVAKGQILRNYDWSKFPKFRDFIADSLKPESDLSWNYIKKQFAAALLEQKKVPIPAAPETAKPAEVAKPVEVPKTPETPLPTKADVKAAIEQTKEQLPEKPKRATRAPKEPYRTEEEIFGKRSENKPALTKEELGISPMPREARQAFEKYRKYPEDTPEYQAARKSILDKSNAGNNAEAAKMVQHEYVKALYDFQDAEGNVAKQNPIRNHIQLLRGYAAMLEKSLNAPVKLAKPEDIGVKFAEEGTAIPSDESFENRKVELSRAIHGGIIRPMNDGVHIGMPSYDVTTLQYSTLRKLGLPEHWDASMIDNAEGVEVENPFAKQVVKWIKDHNSEIVDAHVKPIPRFSEEGTAIEGEEPLGSRINEILQTEHDKAPLSWSSFFLTKPQLDVVRQKVGDKIADSLNDWFVNKDRIFGKAIGPITRATEGLSRKNLNKVEQVLVMENRDKQDYSHLLDDKELGLYNTVREALRQKQQDQIDANQPVTDIDEKGKSYKRLPEIDPFYYPNRIAPKVIDTLTKHSGSSAAENLRNDFIQYHIDQGSTEVAALAKLKQIEAAYEGGEPNLVKFNAVREAEGLGLPNSWMRYGLMKNLSGYFNRVASDRAWHDSIEKNPEVAAKLGLKKDPWDNPYPEIPESEHVKGVPELRDLLHKIHGEGIDEGESKLKAYNRIASSLILGPLTNIHIGASSVANSLQYTNPTETIPAVTHAITHLSEGYQHALENAYLKKDMTSVRDIFDAHNTTLEKLRATASMIGKLNGRNFTDMFTKSYLQAFGEYLIRSKAVFANNGDKTAQALMHRLDPNYEAGKSYTPEEFNSMASTWASLVHGAHDARTLPAWMLKDTAIQPFFQLMSWNIAQTNAWMRHVWTPAKHGDFRPMLISTLGLPIGGYIIKQAREALSDKPGPIPQLQEIVNSSRGLEGNVPAAFYNLAAMASYAGFAGILSTGAKALMDVSFKNLPQAATFPLDEVISNPSKRIYEAIGALMNDPTADIFKVIPRLLIDVGKENVQLARIGIAWSANAGALPYEKQARELNKKEAELRRYKMVEGMPYESQIEPGNNPYMDIDIKRFKRSDNPTEAMQMLPGLINRAMTIADGNIDVLRQQLKKIKQNVYETMPSPEKTPISFYRYLMYLRRTEGPEVANQRAADYFRRNAINKMKGSLVPTF